MASPAGVLPVLATALCLASPAAPEPHAGPWLAQGGTPRVHWLVFVDDLHFDFRSTGHARDLLRAVAATLVRDSDLVSAASSGPSSLDVRARLGGAGLAEAAKHVTGNGLKDEDAVRPPAGRVDEVAYRTRTALTAAAAFVESVGPPPVGERRMLLYLSRGYDLQRPAGRDEAGATALDLLELATARVHAVMVAIEPQRTAPDLINASDPRIAASLKNRRAALVRLVTPTGGFGRSDAGPSRPTLMRDIAALVGR